MADSATVPATVIQLRTMVQRLLAAGVPRHTVHDRIIAESAQHADLYRRAMMDFAHMPRLVREGNITFRNGVGTLAVRRSVSGFQEYLEARHEG